MMHAVITGKLLWPPTSMPTASGRATVRQLVAIGGA
jgi:hypothetical protein